MGGAGGEHAGACGRIVAFEDPLDEMPEKNPFVLFARYSAIIFVLPSCLLLGYFGGAYLDERFATSPYLTLVGFLLGTVAGFVQVFRIVGKKP